MRVVDVARDRIPADFTPEHVRILEHGHEPRVVANGAGGPSDKVLGFASSLGVGVSVFGGLMFVDVSPDGRHGNGPVRIRITD